MKPILTATGTKRDYFIFLRTILGVLATFLAAYSLCADEENSFFGFMGIGLL